MLKEDGDRSESRSHEMISDDSMSLVDMDRTLASFTTKVGKLVGDAISDYSVGSKVTAIGFATWGNVAKRHELDPNGKAARTPN